MVTSPIRPFTQRNGFQVRPGGTGEQRVGIGDSYPLNGQKSGPRGELL